MRKTIICNIPMKETVTPTCYTSNDNSLPVSDKEVRYPINAFLQRTMSEEDELKVILLIKKDALGYFEKNVSDFREELSSINSEIGATIGFTLIETDFKESRSVHEQLLGRIVDELTEGAHIYADITYGPKDLVIVLFTALNFAENYLDCFVDNIVYGQASFVDGKAVDTKICDMIPLYCLSNITNTIRCSDPDKARTMLKALIAL